MTLFKVPYKIILGSSSPRRQDMLRQLGFQFEICKPETVEQRRDGEIARDYVLRNCFEKAEWVMSQTQDDEVMVISADTIVVQGDAVLEKPKSEDDARTMLGQLSGQTHEVLSAFALMTRKDGQVSLEQHCESTKVIFAELSSEDIDFYISTGEPMDKAGSYGIQGIGGFMVKAIDGSYSNVVGLPLHELITAMRRLCP